jgi:hypothetical protein
VTASKEKRNRAASQVKVIEGDEGAQPNERRAFLQRLAAQGLSIPAAYFSVNAGALAHQPGEAYNAAPGSPGSAGGRHILREFSEPYIELIRLLRQASEIEHALMIQYLYGAFSVKPAYSGVVGFGLPNSNDLIGVAAMEMQHLRDVNHLLSALGASPNLVRQGFPFEPEVYPFELNLEPLTQSSVAKYLYCEAAVGTFQLDKAAGEGERRFVMEVERALGPHARPNHVGSLYDALIHVLGEHIASSPETSAQLTPWLAKLEAIKVEGEDGHFKFFKRVFTGTHEGFKGRPDVWTLPRSDSAYPSYPLPSNPTAFIGQENQIKDPTALSLAWLGNLHYWIVLLLADASYTEKSMDYAALARVQMLGPFWSLARHLPKLGAGIPCDPLVTGYAPCQGGLDRLNFLTCMVREADKLARTLNDRLPDDYPVAVGPMMLGALNDKRAAYAKRPG